MADDLGIYDPSSAYKFVDEPADDPGAGWWLLAMAWLAVAVSVAGVALDSKIGCVLAYIASLAAIPAIGLFRRQARIREAGVGIVITTTARRWTNGVAAAAVLLCLLSSVLLAIKLS